MNTMPRMSEGLIEMLYGNEHCQYDLVGGKVTGVTDRVIYLSSDLIRGIYDSLVYEAGEAWSLIFKNCGYIWGKREIERLNKEINIRMRKNLGELTVGEYLDLVEKYFSRQGWGVLKVKLDDAEAKGVVRVSFTNSFFDANLTEASGPVNFMIAGILRAFFEHISQTSLDCVEVSWDRSKDAASSELLISGAQRIEKLAEQISTKPLPVEEALRLLCAA